MATISSYRFKGKSRDSYLECVLNFPLTIISSDDHLKAAQEVMDRLLIRGKLDRGQRFLASDVPGQRHEALLIGPLDGKPVLRYTGEIT